MCVLPHPAALVVRDQPVPVRQGWLREERQKAVCQDGADKQRRLALSRDVVFQVRAIHACGCIVCARITIPSAGRLTVRIGRSSSTA